jgi:hypothetical protein
MAITDAKLTAQGQISVSGRHTSEDVHRALFETPPEPRSLEDLKDGVRKYVASRHARP